MKELNALERSAKCNADNFEPVTVAGTKEILAIAEAFRALEQRAEAAEANACQDIECHSDFMPVYKEMVARGKRVDELEAELKAVTESRDQWEANAHEFSRCVDRIEAKLAELENQEPAGKWIVQYSITEDGYDRHSFAAWRGNQPENNAQLFTRPAPAVSLADVVPVVIPQDVYQVIYHECGGFVDVPADATVIWSACRAAILRNIEEQSQ